MEVFTLMWNVSKILRLFKFMFMLLFRNCEAFFEIRSLLKDIFREMEDSVGLL
jgi:hypothetical protein